MKTVKSLIETFKKLKQVSGNDPVIPVLEYALVKDGRITGSDLSIVLDMPFPYEGEFLLPIKQVSRILAKLNKDQEVGFRVDDNKITMEVYHCNTCKPARSFTFQFDESDVKDFPKTPEVDLSLGSYISEKELAWMQDAVNFCSNDELRPSMTGLYYGDYIAATNGHMLYFRKAEGYGVDTSLLKETNCNKKGIILPAKMVLLMKEMQSISTGISHDYSNPIFLAHDIPNDIRLIGRCIDEHYPDFINVVPTEWNQVVRFNRKQMIKEMEMAMIVANKTTRQGQFNMEGGKATFVVENLDINEGMESKDIAEVTYLSNFCVDAIGFNVALMKDCLNGLKEEEVSLNIYNAGKAMVLNGYMLLMPVMLHSYA